MYDEYITAVDEMLDSCAYFLSGIFRDRFGAKHDYNLQLFIKKDNFVTFNVYILSRRKTNNSINFKYEAILKRFDEIKVRFNFDSKF